MTFFYLFTLKMVNVFTLKMMANCAIESMVLNKAVTQLESRELFLNYYYDYLRVTLMHFALKRTERRTSLLQRAYNLRTDKRETLQCYLPT